MHVHGATRVRVLALILPFSLVVCLHVSLGDAEVAAQDSVERHKITAEDLWNEIIEGRGKADDHDHWERIVRRSVDWYDPYYSDDTSDIVNVQDYYRYVLEEQEWTEDSQAMGRLMYTWNYGKHASIQIEDSLYTKDLQKRIPGRYIVMLDSSADGNTLDRTISILQQAHTESEGRIRVDHITPMRNLGVGFTATMNSKAIELMIKHPFLEVIEEDIALKRSGDTYSDPSKQADAQSSHVPWNLDRLDQRYNHLDGQFKPEGTGEHANIYIIDTGIRYTHHEFEGRAKYAGFDTIDKLTGSLRKGEDSQGHGTHCAGTAAGKTYGVAKKAHIYSLRALGSSGSGAVSGIIEGMDFIAKQMENGVHKGPVVLSMSLGVKESPSLNTAIKRVTEKGIVVVSAAGNQGSDSCEYSPASARVGIAVGATNRHDDAVQFSNAGACTDVYAPGLSIRSAFYTCDTCTQTLSGTSMAAPHVAGYMAVLLSLHPKMTATQAKQHMIEQSTKDVVGLAAISGSLASRTPNRFLYVPQATAKDSDLGETAEISYAYITNYPPLWKK